VEDQEKGKEHRGITRRVALRRGAVIGGALVWAAPAVQTLARPAFAGALHGGSPVGNTYSYVAVLFRYGNKLYRVKVGGQANPGPIPSSAIDCSGTWTADGCHFKFFRWQSGTHNTGPGCRLIQNSCPAGLTATQFADGTITVTAPGATVMYLHFHNGVCCVNDVPAVDAQSCEGGNGTNGGGDTYCTNSSTYSGVGTDTATFPGPAPNGNTMACCH
jgi:hypothetical protein